MDDKVKKLGAFGILLTILSGPASIAYSQIRANELDIAKMKEREKSAKELMIEMKADVKYIRRKLEEFN